MKKVIITIIAIVAFTILSLTTKPDAPRYEERTATIVETYDSTVIVEVDNERYAFDGYGFDSAYTCHVTIDHENNSIVDAWVD